MKPLMESMKLAQGLRWWPEDLGNPDAAGSQNDVHYAYFKGAHRLLLLHSNQIAAYDSGNHEIQGISQTTETGQAILMSNMGPIDLSQLKRL
jgi:hypothetical protein